MLVEQLNRPHRWKGIKFKLKQTSSNLSVCHRHKGRLKLREVMTDKVSV